MLRNIARPCLRASQSHCHRLQPCLALALEIPFGIRCFKSRSIRPKEDPTAPEVEINEANLEKVREITGYYVVGSGDHGQLGVKDVDVALSPKKIDLLDDFAASSGIVNVITGHNHSIAVLRDGRAVTWGYNASGQCGVGHREKVEEPVPMVGLEGHAVRRAAAGPLQSWLITENLRTGKQAVWHAGAAYADERPDDQFTTHTAVPRKVKKKDYLGAVKVTKIIPSGDFCYFLTEQNRLYGFGSGLGVGALGQGEARGDESDAIAGPTIISELENMKIVDAAVGWGHSLALSGEGDVFSWGSNRHGQCGVDLRSESVWRPRQLKYFSRIPVKQIVCGETHSMALDRNGNVHVWGSAAEGKLGLGEEVKEDLLAPRQLHFFDGKNVMQLAAGVDHSAALTSDGLVYVWGFGQHGALSGLTELKNAWKPLLWPPSQFYSPDDPDEEAQRPDPKTVPSDYPFIIDGIRVSESEYFDTCYNHQSVQIQCGMDITMVTLRSTLKPKYDKRLDE